MTATETYTSTVAMVGKCSQCGTKIRKDVQFRRTLSAFNGRPHTSVTIVTPGVSEWNGRTTVACPTCDHWTINLTSVRGTYSDRKRCGARCTSAIGPSCDCQCAGENHGRDHQS